MNHYRITVLREEPKSPVREKPKSELGTTLLTIFFTLALAFYACIFTGVIKVQPSASSGGAGPSGELPADRTGPDDSNFDEFMNYNGGPGLPPPQPGPGLPGEMISAGNPVRRTP